MGARGCPDIVSGLWVLCMNRGCVPLPKNELPGFINQPEAQDKLIGLVVTQVSFLSNLEIISTIFAKLQNSTRVPRGVFRS